MFSETMCSYALREKWRSFNRSWSCRKVHPHLCVMHLFWEGSYRCFLHFCIRICYGLDVAWPVWWHGGGGTHKKWSSVEGASVTGESAFRRHQCLCGTSVGPAGMDYERAGLAPESLPSCLIVWPPLPLTSVTPSSLKPSLGHIGFWPWPLLCQISSLRCMV